MSGTERTNNGWVITDDWQRVYVGQDADGATFRTGDVATLFAWFFNQLHVQVEPVRILNGARTVADNSAHRGDPGSNHMSATAGDVNGDVHPYEPHVPPGTWRSGWSARQVAQVRAIMASTGGLIAWGLDYRPGWRDAMHFDIARGVTPARVAAFVATLTPPPPPPVEDDDVSDFALYLITDDGRVFLGGPGTWNVIPDGAALPVLQAKYGLPVPVSIGVGQLLDDTFTGGH